MAKGISRSLVVAVVVALLVGPLAGSDRVSAETPWTKVKNRAAHGGATMQTQNPGAVVAYQVQARKFAIWYVAGPGNGRIAVYLNGARVRIVDQYAPKREQRSIVLKSTRPVNSVMVVALGTKRPKSTGALVNVDAISPTPTKCTKACLRAPEPTMMLSSLSELALDPVWYPAAALTPDQPLFNVAIGSYVRGQDVLPLEVNAPLIRQAACEHAQRVPQGIMVLSFGKQVEGGSSGFGIALTAADIVAATAQVAGGLAECASGPWEVAVGTSNSGGATPFNGYDGGVFWAQIVEQARAASDPRVLISGANDIEPSWGPVAQARAWVNGFVASSPRRLWNFGSADGCPQSVGGMRCNNGWTIDDVLWVSSHAGPTVMVMPQIHTQSGSQARQWAVIAARGLELNNPVRIGAVGFQTSACAQVRGGCPTTGNTAWQAWQQLRDALDAIPVTAGMAIGAPRDVRWSWR
jgi:hypothetical protein